MSFDSTMNINEEIYDEGMMNEDELAQKTQYVNLKTLEEDPKGKLTVRKDSILPYDL